MSKLYPKEQQQQGGPPPTGSGSTEDIPKHDEL